MLILICQRARQVYYRSALETRITYLSLYMSTQKNTYTWRPFPKGGRQRRLLRSSHIFHVINTHRYSDRWTVCPYPHLYRCTYRVYKKVVIPSEIVSRGDACVSRFHENSVKRDRWLSGRAGSHSQRQCQRRSPLVDCTVVALLPGLLQTLNENTHCTRI